MEAEPLDRLQVSADCLQGLLPELFELNMKMAQNIFSFKSEEWPSLLNPLQLLIKNWEFFNQNTLRTFLYFQDFSAILEKNNFYNFNQLINK